MSFGANLKRERELRGISLEEISRESKISVRLLECIEADRFDQLPEGIFRKSFIRSYARYLGMDEEQTWQEYLLAVEPFSASEEPPGPSPPTVSVARTFPLEKASPRSRISVGVIVLILVLILAAVYASRFMNPASNQPMVQHPEAGQGSEVQRTGPEAVAASTTSAPGPEQETVNVGSESAPDSSTNPNYDLKVLGELAKEEDADASSLDAEMLPAADFSGLTIEAVEEVWIKVTVGERALYSGVLAPQQSKTFALEDPVTVSIGNAGGVRVSVDGKMFSPLGRSGEVRVFDVSKDNYQKFLSPAP